MLKLINIAKTLNPGSIDEKTVFKDFNLTVNSGDFITIIGSNGAGKSTLFNLIAGTLQADDGSIILDNEDITFLPEYKRSKVIGRLFQNPALGTCPEMSIKENLALAYLQSKNRPLLATLKKNDIKIIYDKIAQLNMGLEERLDTPIGLLSGGQRQALTLLMATFAKPKILLLDEHTAALDPSAADTVLKLTSQIVNEGNITTLMVTHNMAQALEMGNRTIMMKDGNIVFDCQGEERKNYTVTDLIAKFRATGTDNDRIILS